MEIINVTNGKRKVVKLRNFYKKRRKKRKKELNNETLIVDTGCLVAFTKDIDYDIQKTGGLKSMFFSGEGFFLATLKGTGTVYLQSLPFSRLANRIIAHAPKLGGKRKGEGSVLGFVGNMIDGR